MDDTLRSSLLHPERTLVMGIVNVTPDSFSDGGDYFDHGAAVAHGLQQVADGADIVDVGGESTRPGSQRPDVAEELRRVVPVVEALAARGVAVSVDTMRAEVAVATAQAGAAIINDVSGGLADPDMLAAVAETGLPYVAMHWRAHGDVMAGKDFTHYESVVADVRGELEARVEAALEAGIARENLILDPGFGFAKDADHNWELLANLSLLDQLGFPLLVGVSRKRFLGSLLGDREPKGRDAATAAVTTLMAARRVWGVRVHDVRSSADAVAVVERLARA